MIRTLKLTNGVSSLRKCCYPSDKQLTAQRTKVMINAETVLDALWTKVDMHFLAKTGESFMKSRAFYSRRQIGRESCRGHRNGISQYFRPHGRVHGATVEPFAALERESRTNITISTDQSPSPQTRQRQINRTPRPVAKLPTPTKLLLKL